MTYYPLDAEEALVVWWLLARTHGRPYRAVLGRRRAGVDRPDPDLAVADGRDVKGDPLPDERPGYPAWPEVGMCVRSLGCVRGYGHAGPCEDPKPSPRR